MLNLLVVKSISIFLPGMDHGGVDSPGTSRGRGQANTRAKQTYHFLQTKFLHCVISITTKLTTYTKMSTIMILMNV